MKQIQCVLPILHTRNADGRVCVTVRHRDRNHRHARAGLLNCARIRAATTGLTKLIGDIIFECCFFKKFYKTRSIYRG